MIFKLIFFLIIIYSLPVFAEEIIYGKPKVIDGDTIHIGKNKIRLFGIDAPEKDQICIKDNNKWLCGESSTSELLKIINNDNVLCKVLDIDQYSRLIAECFKNNININQYMVNEGWALAYRYYSKKYTINELHAKVNKKGIWQSKFINPWDYRKNN